jgi:hypothetical protein
MIREEHRQDSLSIKRNLISPWFVVSCRQDTKPPHGRRGRSIDVSDVVDYSKLGNGNADTTSSLKEPVTRRQGMFARFSHQN